MKVKIPLFVVIVLAMAVGYLMGTENGRLQRDVILVKLGRGPEPDGDGDADAEAETAAEPSAAADDAAADDAADAPTS